MRPARARGGWARRLGEAVEARLRPAAPAATLGRALLTALLAWFTVRQFADREYTGIWSGLNLVLHEAGHLVFGWFGSEWIAAAGGSGFHLICVAATGVVFWRQRDVFAVAVAVWWAGTVFVEAAPYIADARAQVLPLVTVGDGPVSHDWFTILSALGLLAYDGFLAALARLTGLGLLVVGVIAGARVTLASARLAVNTDEATERGED